MDNIKKAYLVRFSKNLQLPILDNNSFSLIFVNKLLQYFTEIYQTLQKYFVYFL